MSPMFVPFIMKASLMMRVSMPSNILSTLHLNIRSLSSNYDKFIHYLSTLKHCFSVIAILLNLVHHEQVSKTTRIHSLFPSFVIHSLFIYSLNQSFSLSIMNAPIDIWLLKALTKWKKILYKHTMGQSVESRRFDSSAQISQCKLTCT